MNIEQIEKNLKILLKNFSKKEFVFDLLLAYGTPKSTITLLKKGRYNLSKQDGRLILKRKLFFQEVKDTDIHETIDNLQKDLSVIKRYSPRFIIVTDYKTLLAVDTKTNEHFDRPIKELVKYCDFFLPWAGIEKHKYVNENLADRKAAEKMAKLYDEILVGNEILEKEKIHDLNVFLVRLLFCFFAEDTNIFENKIFTASMSSHTQENGNDLQTYLKKLFNVLDTKKEERIDLPDYFERFPYVNGELFREKRWIPKFTKHSRKIIIECGKLDWSQINPDIFGSMMQAVVHKGERGSLGMHYTSVPNIMKVIEPLFLNELKEEFEKNIGNKNRLKKLLNRIHKIKIFDPACGSGNFIIISYKELRRLEMDILKELKSAAYFSSKLKNLYGIEIDDFAHRIAKLSLYIAEHQLNLEFKKRFGKINPTLPLKTGGNIICGNATRIDWEKICPKNGDDEIYVLGNPPYLGFNERNKEQKTDIDFAVNKIGNIQRLDYIACWFVKATDYIYGHNAKYAFVSTNSICQGEQVSLIWPYVFLKNQEIFFAYRTFKWSNNAKGKAAVMCVIVGVQNINTKSKKLYAEGCVKEVKEISPYLIESRPIIINQRTESISGLPNMKLGSSGIDGGNLVLSESDKEKFIKADPKCANFIKPFVGGQDFLKDKKRFCLWISDGQRTEAEKNLLVKERIKKCKLFRLSAGRDAKKAANVPHRFFYRKYKNGSAIIVPMTSSERRDYIPIGYYESGVVFSNGVFVIYNPAVHIFGILSSKIHMAWVRITSGRLKNDFRYSVNLSYNTFPILPLTTNQKEEITRCVYAVLEEREGHPEKTLAQTYDPDKMPNGLKEAHHSLDLAVDRCYRLKLFANDEERLEHLFKLYEQMIADEKNNNLK